MSEALQILEKLNALYAGAFTQLLTVTLGFLAFAGILLPLLINWFQTRQLKRDHEALLAKINEDISRSVALMRAEILAEFAKEETKLQQHVKNAETKLRGELEKLAAEQTARTFHLQGVHSTKEKNFGFAARDFAWSIQAWAESEQEANLQSSLKNLMQQLKQVTEKDFDNCVELSGALDEAKEAMLKLNKHGRYDHDLEALAKAVATAKKAKPTFSALPETPPKT